MHRLPVCCLQALPLKCSNLPLSHYCQTHQMSLHSVDIVCLRAATCTQKNPPLVISLILSALKQLLLGLCHLFSSAWFLLAIHYSCFLHTQLSFFLAFRLFPVLSFYFPSASLLYLLWAALWCHCGGPAQLSGPGEVGFSLLITVRGTLNSVSLNTCHC